MGNTDHAFETYSKIVNCEESKSNLMYMAGSYFALGNIHYERNQSAKSREFFVKLFRCAEKMNDYNQMMAIPLFTQQPESVGEMITECLPILLMTGEQNYYYYWSQLEWHISWQENRKLITRKFPAGNWGPGKQEKPGKSKG